MKLSISRLTEPVEKLYRRIRGSQSNKVSPMTYGDIKAASTIVETFQRLTSKIWHETADSQICNGCLDKIAQYALLSQAIMESVSSGILIVEKTKCIGLINSAAKEILELGDEIVGMPLKDVFLEYAHLDRLIDAALRTGCCQKRKELSLKTRKGKEVRLGASFSPIKTGRGEAEAVIIVFTQLPGASLLWNSRGQLQGRNRG